MSVLRLPKLPLKSAKQLWGNLPGAAQGLAIAAAARSTQRFTLLLTDNSQSAERLKEELAFFCARTAGPALSGLGNSAL